jgi:GntR family transcriptional regulator, transcriptional repressor for pyruvate dehydrogenase complex
MLKKLHTPRPVDLTADSIRDEILSGRIAPGERLPPERKLSETLGINRQTLRAALARLQAEGLVKPRQGSGVTVLNWRETAGVSLLPHLVAAGDLSLLEPFLRLRRAVTAEIVASACTRVTDQELDELDELAHALAAETDLEVLANGNMVFSRRLIQLTQNLPIELLFNTFAAIYASREDLQTAMLRNPDALRAVFPAIVGLLRQRQPEMARQVVLQVLTAIDEELLAATLSTLEP